MILMRDTTPRTMRRGTVAELASTPSTRKRTRISSPSGSKWTSDAPCSTAWATIECTSLMTGASPADSRRSTTSAGLSSSSSSTASWTMSSRRLRRLMRPWTSSCDATAGRTSIPVMIAMSSTASTLLGSTIATSSVLSSTKDTGTAS